MRVFRQVLIGLSEFVKRGIILNKYSHIIATSALEFGVMVRPQDVGSDRRGFESL